MKTGCCQPPDGDPREAGRGRRNFRYAGAVKKGSVRKGRCVSFRTGKRYGFVTGVLKT